MQTEHQQNLILDLKKAQQTTLLIDTHSTDNEGFVLTAAQEVYDKGLPKNRTNLIYINTNEQIHKDGFMLLEVLLEMLGEDLQRFQKTRGGVKVVKGLLSGAYKTGKSMFGGIGIDFGTLIENSLGKVADKVVDWGVDKTVDSTADTIQKAMIASGQALTFNLANHRLHLSSEAKEQFIDGILNKLEQDLSLGELVYFTEILLQACSLANQKPKPTDPVFSKLIVIEDPCGLDSISMALLTHLLSVCKDQKDLSYQLSFLYVRTKPDPKEGEIADALINQRTFALRYGMYETPQADYPNRLITPDLFVGRKNELLELVQTASDFYQSNNTTNLISRVIVGEPGMGKTRLVQEHYKQFISELKAEKDKKLIKQEAFTLKLTLYCDNQLSVSSGLSSILASLENEIDRLAEAYKQHKTLTVRFGDFKEGLTEKALEEILPLYKEYQQVKEGLQAWNRDIKQAANKKSEQSMALLDDNNSKNNKEQEYGKLDATIEKLLAIGKKLSIDKKLELFIDDLQWIDEISAEYVLRLINRTDITVRLLATARGSDTLAAITRWQKKSVDYAHCLKLIQALGYQDSKQDWQSNRSIVLPSLDDTQVSQLIQMALKPADLALSDVLAREVKYFLTSENNTHLSTLFVVETLNLLSDDKLYNDTDLSPIFVFEVGRIRFTERTKEELSEYLHKIFNQLEDKYRDSFDSKDGSFNLSSYAVMEERLRLIEQHLGKGYAHLMVFSHLTRTPFEPKLIEKFICAIAQMEGENQQDNELINPLKKQMNEACVEFEAQGLETLEEVYLLLYELERPRRHVIYSHRHRLVELFVGVAFKRMVYGDIVTTKTEEGRLEYLTRVVFHEVINDFLAKHHLSHKNESSLKQNENKRLIAMQEARMINLRALYQAEPELWDEIYTADLNDLALSYQEINLTNEAIELLEKVSQILTPLYNAHPERWAEKYTTSLGNLALSYYKTSRMAEAIDLLAQTLQILTPLYNAHPERWTEQYAISLDNLAHSYKKINHLTEAIELLEKIRKILKPLYNAHPERWTEHYTRCINNLALSYDKTNRIAEATDLLNQSLQIQKPLYQAHPERWAEKYTTSLGNLALSYHKTNRIAEAIDLLDQSLQIQKPLYQAHPERWAENYTISLENFALSYQKINDPAKAIELIEQARQILKPLYQAYPERWTEHYTRCINNLALSYHKTNRIAEAIDLLDQTLQILKPLYHAHPERWAENYTTSLKNLALSYQKINNPAKAIELIEQGRQTLKPLYYDHPEQWAEAYTIQLVSLASSYHNTKRTAESIELFIEAEPILEILYRADSERWAEYYTTSLNNIAFSFLTTNRIAEGIELLVKSMKILRAMYQSNAKFWAELYVVSLTNLAISYKIINRINDAISALEDSLHVIGKFNKKNPKHWAEHLSFTKQMLAELKFNHH